MQGKKDRKEFGPTARFKCTMLTGKVTQGKWMVTETNRLVTKQRKTLLGELALRRKVPPVKYNLQKCSGMKHYLQKSTGYTDQY